MVRTKFVESWKVRTNPGALNFKFIVHCDYALGAVLNS